MKSSQAVVTALLAISVTGCGGSAPSASTDPRDVAVSTHDGPFMPAALAADGHTLVVVGSDADSPDPGRAVVATSVDGGARWRTRRLDAAGLLSVAVAGDTIWVAAECSGVARCVLMSADGGASWRDAGLEPAVDVALADATTGAVLRPFTSGEPSRLDASHDAGATFGTEPDPCGPDHAAVSLDLLGTVGTAACRGRTYTGAEPGDAWKLMARDGDAWTDLYRPAQLAGTFDPNAEPSLSASVVYRAAVRHGWGLLATSAGFYRSINGGASWLPIDLGGTLAGAVVPADEEIFDDHRAVALIAIRNDSWRILASNDRARTWTELLEVPWGDLPPG